MNNILKFLCAIFILLITGCAVVSKPENNSNLPSEELAPGDVESMKSSLVESESLWVIVDVPEKKAGLYSQLKELPVSAVDAHVKLFEFLAAVDLKIAYSQLAPGMDYQFKYPSANGLIIRTFLVEIGNRKLRAVIAAKKEAEEIYKQALMKGKSAHLIQQKNFSDIIVDFSVKEKADVLFNFSYSQLLSIENNKRAFHLPAFSIAENSKYSLNISGTFSSAITEIDGPDLKLSGQSFFSYKSTNLKTLEEGFNCSFKLAKEVKAITSQSLKGKTIKWDGVRRSYVVDNDSLNEGAVKVTDGIFEPVFNFLEFQKMVSKKVKYEDLLDWAVSTKLLTPLTGLLLIDARP